MFQNARLWWLDSPYWFESGVTSSDYVSHDHKDAVVDFSVGVPSWYQPWMTTRQSFIDRYDDEVGLALMAWGPA